MNKDKTTTALELESEHVAPNYNPLPVVIRSGDGVWVEDVEGEKYLDALAGYSALNFGHSNRALLDAAKAQLERLTMTSRAFYNDQLGPFASELAELTGHEMVLPMNTGAEAVETAIKAARKWGYRVKGVPTGQAQIIVADSNFHGRTTTIVSFSDDRDAKDDFGPHTPGFVTVPFADLQALKDAVTPDTVAVLIELVQGEAGVRIADKPYVQALRDFCSQQDILLIVDEIQSGFGRTGETFASELYEIKPDLMLLGKALGGGVLPVSAVVGRSDVLGQLTAGTHGSTFGGNPLAAAVGREVIQLMNTGEIQENARARGKQLGECLGALQEQHPEVILGFSQVGLWAGIEFDPAVASGREVCELMMERHVLVKDAHGSIVRLSPPLTITQSELDVLCLALTETAADLAKRRAT